jgi:hypothetical protein
MKTYPPNFRGWHASTNQDPHELIIAILRFSHELDMSKLGVSGPTQNIIVFSGIQIQFIEKYSYETYLGRKLFLHFIDGKRIKPKFFDAWEYMKANNYVHGGPDKEDKAFFCGGKYAELQELDDWTDRYYSMPISRTFTRMNQLEQEGCPIRITERKIQDRAREREKLYGEKFTQKITRKKK